MTDADLLPCPLPDDRIDKTGDCWLWTGAKNNKGYGNFRSKSAHRVAYEAAKGKIPDGLTVDHLCNNPSCVNPAHLEVKTQYDNNMRGNSPTAVNRRKDVCVMGHLLEGDNVKLQIRKDGIRRKCKECQKIYKREARKNAKR